MKYNDTQKIHMKQNIYCNVLQYLCDDPTAFIDYTNDMDNIYQNIDKYSPNKKHKSGLLIAFDDMITDMLSNKKRHPIVSQLFIRRRKISIYLAFITLSYYAVTKNISLNSTYYFIMKFPNKRELQQIAIDHSSDIDFGPSQITEQAKFRYPFLGKAFENQKKTIEKHGKNRVRALELLKSSEKQLRLIKGFISEKRLILNL